MRKALQLAAKGYTSPNPKVGCILVKEGTIIGKGYHQQAGLPHAEINALTDATKQGYSPKDATMYVTLEPCCMQGRTPPCVPAICAAGIKEVVVAMEDPNPLVHGKGIALLKQAGISVRSGILATEAENLNESYRRWITTKLPFVILKVAMTLDGKIAIVTGDSRWISNEASRRYVHRLRSSVDAVLVGVNTVLKDNPQLTSRVRGGKNPCRVVLDAHARIPLDIHVLNADAKTIIVTSSKAPGAKVAALKEHGVGVIVVNTINDHGNDHLDMHQLLQLLGKREITSILVEGGREIFTTFVTQQLFDKILVFIAPKLLGGEHSLSVLGGKDPIAMTDALLLKNITTKRFGDDFLIQGYR
ncbi:bifunctional diaminohydroxyphosphoribosylaminopyrimidine deaminase/5-amino-6-(5-phosphoribosylamino)uracil reductase RibD [Candidatus Woesearchaeota archaeon]|nr:bifunctional diaminohydroxyphosphoribosylaminopyrimidine deaminase/5-amino-6-(5-phosphoribosylamino)uracil reductase RibD [Candidatus Woesearchaeota archaeon]